MLKIDVNDDVYIETIYKDIRLYPSDSEENPHSEDEL